jgi:hypothetical protein
MIAVQRDTLTGGVLVVKDARSMRRERMRHLKLTQKVMGQTLNRGL